MVMKLRKAPAVWAFGSCAPFYFYLLYAFNCPKNGPAQVYVYVGPRLPRPIFTMGEEEQWAVLLYICI